MPPSAVAVRLARLPESFPIGVRAKDTITDMATPLFLEV